ncbi:hypothetical protein PR202_ga10527 [Eleusine coracana subsp. coracana]|uniref:Uncharacterized protein n=1 Tax=Eleusine coracana subsp. coracana TaxID=191504 RepID=A0AAV5C702_ELECO|nr:hypothetical protein PR202_ga10527 [Eleusine coracana subsp. coracana]
MAASPETDALLSIGDMYSSPSPPSPVLPPAQQNSSLTTAAPPESAQLYHTTPTPLPPPPQQDNAEYSELGESSLATDGEDPAPLLASPEAVPTASPALEAASPEKPAFPPSCPSVAPVAPSCPPGAPVEVFPDVSASAASPPPSPQFGEAPPGDAPPPLSPPPTPPVTTSTRAVLDSSTTELVAMAFREAASPPPASELNSHSAPAPLTPPLESGPEGLSLQQHLRPAGPAMTPRVCENPKSSQPRPLPAGSTYMLSDAAADEVAVVASAEAAGSTPALEEMDGERDTAPDVPPALENGAEGELQQQQPRSPCSDLVHPLYQYSEPAELLQLPSPPAESSCSLEAAMNEVAAVASEEAAGSPPALDATGGEAALESRSEGPLQEPMKTSSSPKMEAEGCSPDMAPPGFENFKSKWLPQAAHALPVKSSHCLVEVPVTDTAGVMPEAAAGSLPSLETMDMEMDISTGWMASSKSAENRPLHQSLMSPSSLTNEAAPCSPDTPPPGFENFKTSWLPQPTVPPSTETTYLPYVATTKEELMEKSCSVPALDTTDMKVGTDQNLLPTLENGAGGLLEVPQSSSPSPKMQPVPCSPGIESLTLPQLQLLSPVVQTSHISQDPAATRALYLISQDAPQPCPVSKAMDDTPALPTSSESGAHESTQQEPSWLPSYSGQGITCSLEIMSSGSDNSESLNDAENTTVTVEAVDHPLSAENTTVTVEAVDHPLSVAEATEEAKGHILPPQLEKGCNGPLPCLEPKVSSSVAQDVPTSPENKPVDFESLESSQQTSPHLAERIDSPSHVPFTKSMAVQSPLKGEEKSLRHPQHQPSSPSGKDAPCLPDIALAAYENLDSSEELPPPPPLCPNFAHQVGKLYCGQCETLLMSAMFVHGCPQNREHHLTHKRVQRCLNCLGKGYS